MGGRKQESGEEQLVMALKKVTEVLSCESLSNTIPSSASHKPIPHPQWVCFPKKVGSQPGGPIRGGKPCASRFNLKAALTQTRILIEMYRLGL